MASSNTDNLDQAVEVFRRFNVDEQLALLWFIYVEIKDALNPATETNETGFTIAQGLVNQIGQMSPEEQLQLQRDLLQGSNSAIADAYAGFNSSNRLAFWYLLAQGMEDGFIVSMPSDFQLSSEAQSFLTAFSSNDFERQITFIRSVVSLTGNTNLNGVHGR